MKHEKRIEKPLFPRDLSQGRKERKERKVRKSEKTSLKNFFLYNYDGTSETEKQGQIE